MSSFDPKKRARSEQDSSDEERKEALIQLEESPSSKKQRKVNTSSTAGDDDVVMAEDAQQQVVQANKAIVLSSPTSTDTTPVVPPLPPTPVTPPCSKAVKAIVEPTTKLPIDFMELSGEPPHVETDEKQQQQLSKVPSREECTDDSSTEGSSNGTTTESVLQRKTSSGGTTIVIFGFQRLLVFLLAIALMAVHSFWNREILSENSVCVTGGGFSGFWYTLGRLDRMEDNENENEYYCYSSGCLAAVASLRQLPKDTVYDMARVRQKMWQEGTTSRFAVVPGFVDDILAEHDGSKDVEHILANLRIITASRGQWMKGVVRTPQSVEELRHMLMQTTWIPFALGNGWWIDGHMDGAFSLGSLPFCATHIRAVTSLQSLFNMLNISLSRGMVDKLWKEGRKYEV